MVSAGFELTPADLDTAATGIEQATADLAGRLDAARSTVEGAGNPWGADEQGSVFGQLYTAVASSLLDTAQTHHDQLDYASRSLHAWSQSATQTDTGAQQRFAALEQGLTA